MFEKVSELGEGAFGIVYKVKCLQTTAVDDDSGQRIAYDNKGSATVIKRKLHQRNLAAHQHGKVKPKPLIADNYYVIKVVDTANLKKEYQDEALKEII